MSDEPTKEALAEAEDLLEDDEDGLDEEDFDAGLSAVARNVGLNPGDFDTQDALCAETQARIRDLQASSRSPGAPEAQGALAELKVVLENKDDLDPKLVGALEKLAAASGENFTKLLKRIESSSAQPGMQKQLEHLAKSVSALSAQNTELRFERWIAGSPDVQRYLGQGLTAELDSNGKHARRRRAVMKGAYGIDGRRPGTYTKEQLFSRSLKKRTAKQEPTAVSPKEAEPTRIARASGSKTTELVGGPDESKAARRTEAAEVVAKFRHNAG